MIKPTVTIKGKIATLTLNGGVPTTLIDILVAKGFIVVIKGGAK